MTVARPSLVSQLRALCVASVLSMSAFGCAGDSDQPTDSADDDSLGGSGDTSDGDPSPGDADMTDSMFDPDRVLEVNIEMVEADWELIRHQTRTIWDILGGDCLAQPFPRPFTYAPADVYVDDVLVEHVGVRKKGFLGSLSVDKPSLKIKFGEYKSGQELSGLKRMTLNNAQQDASYLNQCLGYALFADAGIPAPRCNFAHVTVNDEELGLYVHVESVKQRFLTQHFEDDSGPLYEGTLSDFRPDWTGTFAPKVNKSLADKAIIHAITTALEVGDDELLSALEPVLDVDAFLTFWAMEVLVGHWDGYAGNTNNFYVYHDPATGQAQFMPWGIDALFREQEEAEGEMPESVYAAARLARRLYLLPETRARYIERMNELVASVWNEEALVAEIERMDSLIDPYAGDVLQDLAVAGTEAFVRDRAATITAELASGGPGWTAPEREPMCFSAVGQLTATFDTTFGTLADEDWFNTGSAEIEVIVDSDTLAPTLAGAGAGWKEEDVEGGPRVQVAMVAVLDNEDEDEDEDEDVLLVVVELAPHRVVPGALINNDWVDAFAAVVRFESATGEQEIIGYLGQGVIELRAAGVENGDAIVGSVSGELLEIPW